MGDFSMLVGSGRAAPKWGAQRPKSGAQRRPKAQRAQRAAPRTGGQGRRAHYMPKTTCHFFRSLDFAASMWPTHSSRVIPLSARDAPNLKLYKINPDVWLRVPGDGGCESLLLSPLSSSSLQSSQMPSSSASSGSSNPSSATASPRLLSSSVLLPSTWLRKRTPRSSLHGLCGRRH